MQAWVHGPTNQRRGVILATVCVAVLAVNLDGTIVNVALPTLSRQLHAGTGRLQWVVDGYNLAFAALVLTGGAIGDRLGRRPVLIGGLVGFAAASLAGSAVHTSAALVACRIVMGACAALIYPTTLSIITAAYPDRKERRTAIGIWGAVSGLGVAIGPVSGGLLLGHFWWGSIFLALAPVAVVAAVAAAVVVPESSDPDGSGIDVAGLVTSSAAIAILVETFIEAPSHGWGSAWTIGGFVLTAMMSAAFAYVEHRSEAPMLDLAVFRVPAFSAASGAVTTAFFALFGFIFLITQYMQLVRHWSTLSTGLRILPVAGSIAVGSVVGSKVAERAGTRAVVVTGLTVFGSAFAWIAVSPVSSPYYVIAAQMVLMGLGLGLTSAPATESILSVLPAAKAGVGSAINDATREAGGTLGVAVVGSIWSSVYLHHLSASPAVAALPAHAAALARSGVAASYGVAHSVPGAQGAALASAVTTSFMSALHVACFVVAGVCWLGAVGSSRLPGRPAAVSTAEAPLPVTV